MDVFIIIPNMKVHLRGKFQLQTLCSAIVLCSTVQSHEEKLHHHPISQFTSKNAADVLRTAEE